MRSVHVVGISHRSAGPDALAAMSLRPDQVHDLAEAARSRAGLELVTLATCNRTEFYLAGVDQVAGLEEVLAGICPHAPRIRPEEGWYQHTGPAAVRHLMRVVCGLDSQLLGDGQIVGQVRRAVTVAMETKTYGGVLSPLFAQALRTGRQARQVTDIGAGNPGVAGAIASLVTRSAPPLPNVLVLGAGETARLTTQALHKTGSARLVVANRTDSAARDLADQFGSGWVPWSQVPGALTAADVVIVATGADSPVLTHVPPRTRRLLVVDAGNPPQVSAAVAGPTTELVTLPDLRAADDAAAAARAAAVPQVEALLEEAVATWCRNRDNDELEAAIKQLHQTAREAAFRIAHLLADRCDVPVDMLEGPVHRTLKALLHEPVSQLRAARTTPFASELSEAVSKSG